MATAVSPQEQAEGAVQASAVGSTAKRTAGKQWVVVCSLVAACCAMALEGAKARDVAVTVRAFGGGLRFCEA